MIKLICRKITNCWKYTKKQVNKMAKAEKNNYLEKFRKESWKQGRENNFEFLRIQKANYFPKKYSLEFVLRIVTQLINKHCIRCTRYAMKRK